MAAASDYITGTISLTNGEVEFTGAGTGWLLAHFKEGDTIIDITGATEFMGVIATIDANGAGTLTKAWEGPTLTNVAYRMRYQPDGARTSAQARNLIELLGNGNVLAVAGLSGSANQVIMFTGPGTMTTVPKSDLVSGADYDVQVADEAALAAYDGQSTGFAVLVSDDGAGRAYIVSKMSNSAADWSDPAYVTGPTGPLPVITVGEVTTGAPGTDVEVVGTPTIDGVELDFTIPAGDGFLSRGDYAGGTAYAKGDVVQQSGSSWISKQATTGNAPPTLPTTSNAYWQLLARRGIDGAGTVNAVAAGTGVAVNSADPTAPVVSVVAFTGDSGLGGTVGGVPAPAAGDAAANKFLSASGSWLALDLSSLEITVSLLALQVADNTNVALFLGDSGNRVADSFDALTYVDVAGATNLDTSVTGLLKPTTGAATLISQATGTPIGNFGENGGSLALLFDGTTNAGASGAAVTNTTQVSGKYFGKTYSGGQVVSKARIYGRNDGGYLNSGTGETVTVELCWKDGAAPNSTASDVTVAGTISFTEVDTTNMKEITSNTSVPHDHWVLRFSRTGAANAFFAVEGEFYAPGTTNNLTVRSTSFTAAAVPTKMKALLRVKEVDAAVAGTDYTLECSRNGGTSWTTMTLTETFTSASPTSGIRVVEAAETNVSGQSSGTATRWRFKTLNNKMVELHDLYFYWS